MNISDIPLNIRPDELMSLVQGDERLLNQFMSADPEMGEALRENNLPMLRMVMMKRQLDQHRVGWQREQQMAQIHADPMSEENQKRIEEAILQEQIQQNLEYAMENMPEAFGRVCMLYVLLEINGQRIKAFVDSGAQSTIMSARMAEKCGLMRLLDKRFAGEARGVGTAKILGRIHIAQMKLGNSFFPVTITVLENNDVDFLFGLDMLKRHQCEIDLRRNVLRVQGVSDLEEIPFLPEHELPTNARGTLPEDVPGLLRRSSSSSSPRLPVPPVPPPTAAEADKTPAQKIQELMDLGFPEPAAIAALRQADGNVELAANLLFAGMS